MEVFQIVHTFVPEDHRQCAASLSALGAQYPVQLTAETRGVHPLITVNTITTNWHAHLKKPVETGC